MIIENGEIRLIQAVGGGVKKGVPQPVENRIVDVYPCNVRAVQEDRKGKDVDSTYTRVSYEILIDQKHCFIFDAKRVSIRGDRGRELGEFEVQRVQYLDAVNAIKIYV